MMKKIFAIACTLLMLSACQSGQNSMSGAWLNGDRSSTFGDQTNAVNVIYYDYDSSSVNEAAKVKIQQQVDMWYASKSKPTLVVAGHADERGTIDYNLALGERRAYAVQKELQKMGIPADKIQTVSYGKERPAVLGNDESAWALNRRAVTIATKN